MNSASPARSGLPRPVIGSTPEYLRFALEACFGHYLMLAGAVGGADCGAQGSRFGTYENGISTGQAHFRYRP
ncbi:hypothetical protein [Streptomyces syringium]|uniref:hypothetical protein n=1 Tax=Streptomyces syringium TaxID=76729 RepID=UPI0033E61EC8